MLNDCQCFLLSHTRRLRAVQPNLQAIQDGEDTVYVDIEVRTSPDDDETCPVACLLVSIVLSLLVVHHNMTLHTHPLTVSPAG